MNTDAPVITSLTADRTAVDTSYNDDFVNFTLEAVNLNNKYHYGEIELISPSGDVSTICGAEIDDIGTFSFRARFVRFTEAGIWKVNRGVYTGHRNDIYRLIWMKNSIILLKN